MQCQNERRKESERVYGRRRECQHYCVYSEKWWKINENEGMSHTHAMSVEWQKRVANARTTKTQPKIVGESFPEIRCFCFHLRRATKAQPPRDRARVRTRAMEKYSRKNLLRALLNLSKMWKHAQHHKSSAEKSWARFFRLAVHPIWIHIEFVIWGVCCWFACT